HRRSKPGGFDKAPHALFQGENGGKSQRLRKPKNSTRPQHDSGTMGSGRKADARSFAGLHVRGGFAMKLTAAEIEFLSAWAKEEWEPACYQRPAHRLQLAHGVTGVLFVPFIKAWTKAEGKKDQDILQ